MNYFRQCVTDSSSVFKVDKTKVVVLLSTIDPLLEGRGNLVVELELVQPRRHNVLLACELQAGDASG